MAGRKWKSIGLTKGDQHWVEKWAVATSRPCPMCGADRGMPCWKRRFFYVKASRPHTSRFPIGYRGESPLRRRVLGFWKMGPNPRL